MTKKELLEKMTEIHNFRFYLSMKDIWSQEDFQDDYQKEREYYKLKEEYESKYGKLPQ